MVWDDLDNTDVVDDDVNSAAASGNKTSTQTGDSIKGDALPDDGTAADGVGVGVRLTLRLWAESPRNRSNGKMCFGGSRFHLR
ncbi:hypothetical protein ID866_9095 [Astraeus odoratus]|nr:hypothetical protein ID866_9095 [Astraeus odoratus]